MVISAAFKATRCGAPTHLGTPPHAAVVATERDALVLDDDVPQVLVGLADVHAFDGLGRLTGVLFTRSTAELKV